MMGSPVLHSTTLTKNFDAFDMNAGCTNNADRRSFKDSATNLSASSCSPALRQEANANDPEGESQRKVESTKMCQGQVIDLKFNQRSSHRFEYILSKHQGRVNGDVRQRVMSTKGPQCRALALLARVSLQTGFHDLTDIGFKQAVFKFFLPPGCVS